jgi:hypothetical protein
MKYLILLCNFYESSLFLHGLLNDAGVDSGNTPSNKTVYSEKWSVKNA